MLRGNRNGLRLQWKITQLAARIPRGGQKGAHQSVCGVGVRYFIRHVQVLTMDPSKFAIEVDDTWFENNLQRKTKERKDRTSAGEF